MASLRPSCVQILSAFESPRTSRVGVFVVPPGVSCVFPLAVLHSVCVCALAHALPSLPSSVWRVARPLWCSLGFPIVHSVVVQRTAGCSASGLGDPRCGVVVMYVTRVSVSVAAALCLCITSYFPFIFSSSFPVGPARALCGLLALVFGVFAPLFICCRRTRPLLASLLAVAFFLSPSFFCRP
jgi:hypothetical protein